jgi:hypothetical protein
MLHVILLLLSLIVSLITSLTGILFMLMPHQNVFLWPQEWLNGTPFRDFRMPGLLFVLLVGATNFWGFMNLLNDTPRQYDRVMLGGYSLIGWVMAELLLSRQLYLVHVSALILGAMLVLLAYEEKSKWAV